MGFILLIVLIIVLIEILAYSIGDISDIIASGIASCIFGSVIIIGILTFSYVSYINIHKYRIIINQHKNAINLYTDKAVNSFTEVNNNEITDLKYNNYQEQVGKMINYYRNTAIEHNKIMTGKKLMNDSWFWNWLIIMPEYKILKVE